MEEAPQDTAPAVVALRDLGWELARYRDENQVRGEYRDLGGALGTRAVGANIHRLEPGQENARYHAHELEEELFYVLDGSPTLRLDGRSFRLSSGHLVHCPPWSAHTFRNEADEPCSILMTSNRCGRPDAVYPVWKTDAEAAPEPPRNLDPRDERVRHTAELGWEDDPHGRRWGGIRNLTERFGLTAVAAEIRILRPGALVPYQARTEAEHIHLVLEGEVEMLRDGREITLREGEATRIPPGMPCGFRVRLREKARLFSLWNQADGDRLEHPQAPAGWTEPILL